MNLTLSAFADANITSDSVVLLTNITAMIFEHTSLLEEAVEQRLFNFKKVYDFLSHSLYTLHLDPSAIPLYKQSLTTLYSLYQDALQIRCLTPDLYAVQKWISIVRESMKEEVAALYIKAQTNGSTTENSFRITLANSFTVCLLQVLSSLVPTHNLSEEKKKFQTIAPLYSDFFDIIASPNLVH